MGVDQPVDLTLGLLEIARGAVAVPILFGPLPIHFPVEFIDKGRNQFRVHQLVLKPIQDSRFEEVSSYRQQIVTRALLRAVEQP